MPSNHRANRPKLNDMFKANKATTTQHQFPVIACALDLLFTNIDFHSYRRRTRDLSKAYFVYLIVRPNYAGQTAFALKRSCSCPTYLERTYRQDILSYIIILMSNIYLLFLSAVVSKATGRYCFNFKSALSYARFAVEIDLVFNPWKICIDDSNPHTWHVDTWYSTSV